MIRRFFRASFAVLGLMIFASCGGKVVDSVQLIPMPQSVTINSYGLDLDKLQTISVPVDWGFVADNFVMDLSQTAGLDLERVDSSGVITVLEDSTMQDEQYTVRVTPCGVMVSASSVKGVNRAFSTLEQLVLTSLDLGQIPSVMIEDSPRFSYRGLMIDCSRHFWTVEELKESIRHMSFFKLNTLHLHLTDNNGWRLAMDKYPQLTEAGTYFYDFPELSGKYYTVEDLKEVVAYATQRGVDVLPEVDLPGHASALLAALPYLSCRGGRFEAYPEEREISKRKRAAENMICIGNPRTIQFVEDVVDALVEIFPYDYLHLGGDEVPTNIWEGCPKCRRLYRREGMSHWGEVQDYFTTQVRGVIESRGRRMAGWDEINERHVATPDDLVMVWRNYGEPMLQDALERDIPVIMAPQHGCYFDWGYAGNSTRKAYEFEPIKDSLSESKSHLIRGVQACLWTERVPTQERLEWMLYPRVCALSEVMWSPREIRNWDCFYDRITSYYPIMSKLGINFYDDAALNDAEFVVEREKPALVRHAHIETNMAPNFPYHPEYAFDGRTNSYYWGGGIIDRGHFFKVTLGEPTEVQKITVITGDSKDYITMADLMISTDGETFEKVGEFDSLGESVADLGGRVIRSVRIDVTAQHTCWPIIKEIILE